MRQLLCLVVLCLHTLLAQNSITNSWLITFNTGSNAPHGTVFAGGFFWVLNQSSPSTLVKIDPANPAFFVTIAFPVDAHHNNGMQLVSVGGILYAIFGDSGRVTISAIDPGSLLITDIVSDLGDAAGIKPGMTSDGIFLYVLTYPILTNSKVLRYRISDQTKTSITLSGGFWPNGHAIIFDGAKLYATGDHTPAWVSRIDVSTFTEEDTKTLIDSAGKQYNAATDDLAQDSASLWIGTEDGGNVLQVNKAALIPVVAVVNPPIAGPCFGTFFDANVSPYVWALYGSSPGIIGRINPVTHAVDVFNFPAGQNMVNEMVSDGRSFYFTFFSSPGKASAMPIASPPCIHAHRGCK